MYTMCLAYPHSINITCCVRVSSSFWPVAKASLRSRCKISDPAGHSYPALHSSGGLVMADVTAHPYGGSAGHGCGASLAGGPVRPAPGGRAPVAVEGFGSLGGPSGSGGTCGGEKSLLGCAGGGGDQAGAAGQRCAGACGGCCWADVGGAMCSGCAGVSGTGGTAGPAGAAAAGKAAWGGAPEGGCGLG